MDVLNEWPLLLLYWTMHHHTELWLEFCHTALFILTPIGISFLLKEMCQLYETNPFPRWDTSFFLSLYCNSAAPKNDSHGVSCGSQSQVLSKCAGSILNSHWFCLLEGWEFKSHCHRVLVWRGMSRQIYMFILFSSSGLGIQHNRGQKSTGT